MTYNKKYLELNQELETLNTNNIDNKYLRKIQILERKIDLCSKRKEITKLEKIKLEIKIKKIIKEIIKNYGTKLNKNTLNALMNLSNQRYNEVPTDITIIDNDLTLLLNKSFDNIYQKDEIITLGSKNYEEITHLHGMHNFHKSYYKIFKKLNNENYDYFYNFYFPSNKDFNKNNPSLQILIDNINNLLKQYNNIEKNIEFNWYKNKIVYNKKSQIKIFINIALEDLIVSIFKNKDIKFNLIAFDEWNDIECYKITQKTQPNKYFTWESKKINLNTWNLKKNLQKQKKLTKN